MPLYTQKLRLTASINEQMNQMINGTILKNNSSKYKKEDLYLFKLTKTWLQKYEALLPTAYLEDLNIDWAEGFIVFLTNNNLKQSWIYTIVGCFKLMLKRWYKKGLTSLNPKQICIDPDPSTTVHNTIEELDLLLDLDLSAEPALEKTRDVYIIQSYTGLRYRDLKLFLRDIKAFIQQDGNDLFFEISTRKTNKTVALPVAEIIKPVLEKYKYKIKAQDLADYNKNIKHIAERAGITEQVVLTYTQGGQRTQSVKRKCDIMSSHTARRSFATNALLLGMPHINIMLITGHSSYASFMRYIRCSAKEAALKIAGHPFFHRRPKPIQPILAAPTLSGTLKPSQQATQIQQPAALKTRIYVAMPRTTNSSTTYTNQ